MKRNKQGLNARPNADCCPYIEASGAIGTEVIEVNELKSEARYDHEEP